MAINERADGLQTRINELKGLVEFINAKIKEVKEKMAQPPEKTKLRKNLMARDTKRSWNLRLFGLGEEKGENINLKVIHNFIWRNKTDI